MWRINKEALPRYLTRWHQYILIWKCQAWCYSNWWYPEGGRQWMFQISLICLIYLYKMTHDIPRCRIVWFLQIAYLYKMTRDILRCQIEGFLQIAQLKSDIIWQQESPAEKWKRLLHPNQNSSITPLWIINYHLLTSEYQQCSTTI